MNVMECAEAILKTLAEDYPVELKGLARGATGWSVGVGVGTERVLLRVAEGSVLISPPGASGPDVEVNITRGLLFDILDGTQRMEDALGSEELEVKGDQDIILSLSVVVEDFLGICHRSARIVGILNEFRYGLVKPIS